ncbi:protein ZBED8-like, partial [Octopus sinensis]|uniref:Protein ZBED8-like n=1 Tax=Octopus sinensis TaxID=2607531 RepID=A0A6P7TYB5_9MOLL
MIIAKNKAAHNSGEKLIKPAALEMARILFGPDAVTKLKDIPLSNDSVSRRISELSSDILKQLIERINKSKCRISIQLDESTDISNVCQLVSYVRFVDDENIIDEFLFCLEMDGHTRGEDIFNIFDNFMKTNKIQWDKVGSICTDGAPVMIGHQSGLVTRIKDLVPDIVTRHCALHKYALCSKTMCSSLRETLNTIVKVINYIRSRPLNHRIFQTLCEELGNESLQMELLEIQSDSILKAKYLEVGIPAFFSYLPGKFKTLKSLQQKSLLCL